jgi:hypothetical protein
MQHDAGSTSLLLRLRQSDDRATWLVSVQNVSTGDRRAFPSIEALVTFLLAEYGACPSCDVSTRAPGLEGHAPRDYLSGL